MMMMTMLHQCNEIKYEKRLPSINDHWHANRSTLQRERGKERKRERFICFFFLRFFLFYFIEARWREERNYSRSCVKYTIPLTTKKKRKEQPRRRPKFPSFSLSLCLSQRNTTALCINVKEPTPFFFQFFFTIDICARAPYILFLFLARFSLLLLSFSSVK